MQPSDRDLHWVKAFATAKQPRCGDKHRDPSPHRFQASVAHRGDRVGRDRTVGVREPALGSLFRPGKVGNSAMMGNGKRPVLLCTSISQTVCRA